MSYAKYINNTVTPLALLLTGCSPLFDLYSAARGEYTRPDYSDGAISYRDFQRPYQPRVKYTAEPDIEYVRPDVDGLCSTLKSIGASATGGKAAAADIINQFDAAYDDYVLFNTMGELAYLRYTRDLSDSYYEAEYTWCTDQTTRVEKAMEDCYTTMAKSSLRSALEEQYFGEDFFASYDSDGVYSDARTVALLQQESELQAQYVALQNDPSIEWNGSTRSVSELLENAVTADLYYEVLGAYYDAYGAQAGEIYIKLIQTRRELAGRLGYGSELLAAAGGPAVNLLLAAALAALGRWWEPLYLLAGAQAVLGCFNLLPILPLDGGRMLWLALCWGTDPFLADRVPQAVSLAAAGLLTVAGAALARRSPFLLWTAAALLVCAAAPCIKRRRSVYASHKGR